MIKWPLPDKNNTMADLLRTFIAVKIDPDPVLLNMISELKGSTDSKGIKWVDENNLHLTLKFIGNTMPGRVNEITSVLMNIAGNFPVFSFEMEGVGYFKSRGIPKVLFVKIIDKGSLKNLADEIDIRLADIGFEREERQFHAHLTIARIKYIDDKQSFYRLTDKYKSCPLQKVKVKELILYQSILKSHGPFYKELSVVRLK